MQDKDLVAAFLAKKGATVIPTGRRTTTEHAMKVACGWEPSKVYRYEAQLVGEDGQPFAANVTSMSRSRAIESLRIQYPESQIVSVEYAGTRADMLAMEAAHDYDM